MRSLRFRVPAFFVLGVLIAGLVTSVIAVRLFQDYVVDQTVNDLRRQARGLADLYEQQALQSVDEGTAPPRLAAPKLEEAAGANLYYVGVEIFPGQTSGLRELRQADASLEALPETTTRIEFTPPGENRAFVAIVEPVTLGGETFGALVVAKPKAELGDRWLVLVWRVGLAFLGGLVVAAGLFWYLSRRLTQPVLALSAAADQVAQGRYDVELPQVRTGDEIAHLADRFREMTEHLAEASERERSFLMTVSHELRTPLTAIRGHVDALREGLVEDAAARDASLEVIRTETDRLARLVGDLLDLAKLNANRFTLVDEEVDFGRLLEHAYQGFVDEARRRAIDYGREIVDAPVLNTDGNRVLQIVSNLLANAFEWTPDGGRVDLALECGRRELVVSVTDSGPGVAPGDEERIFHPFWSGQVQGTGLGLAIARELAQALGGRLDLESVPGGGSRFDLHLPLPPSPRPLPAPELVASR